MIYSAHKTLLFIIILITSNVYSQSASGIVVYEASVNKTYVDSFAKAFNERKDVGMDMKQRISDYYNYDSSLTDLFTLEFNGSESQYKYDQPLEKSRGDILRSLASKNSYYINNNTKKIIEKSTSLGFISQKPLEWKILKQTKKIGNYTCHKAITTERLYSRRGFYYNRQIAAWFSPEIPVSYGPSKYVGLPGLVLEVYRDKFTLRAKEIKLNPIEEIKIKRPKENAKIITEEQSHGRIAELTKERKGN